MSDFENNFFDDNNVGSGEQYGSYQYNNGRNNFETPEDKSPKKKQSHNRRNHSKWGRVVASALVFGLVAGTATYGVNYAANQINPVTVEAAATDSEDADTVSTTTTASTGATLTTTTSGDSEEMTVSEVAASAMPSMVTISTLTVQEMQSFFGGSEEYEVEGAGTGVIIAETDDEIMIATNNHVIDGADTVSVGFIDESVVEAYVKGVDESTDLAVVAVAKSDISEDTLSQIKVITIGDSDELELGDQVVAIGNALGYGQSVTSGYVSALDRSLELSDGDTTYTSTGLIQTDAAINSGNSGGALLNMKGELVGINEAKSSTTSSGTTVDNMGFAIPLAKAQSILEDLMNGESTEKLEDDERGYLGVNITDVTEEYSEIYGIPEGVAITNVPENSAAAEAGLQVGDVIVSFEGTTVDSSTSLSNLMAYYAPGETVTLTVMRQDGDSYTEIEVEVTLQESTTTTTSTGTDSSADAGQGYDMQNGITSPDAR